MQQEVRGTDEDAGYACRSGLKSRFMTGATSPWLLVMRNVL